DGGITILDNMLEGQTNPINIETQTGSIRIENNYFEANGGDYLVRISGHNPGCVTTLHPNYMYKIEATDCYRFENTGRIFETNNHTSLTRERKSIITFHKFFLAAPSSFSG